MNVVCTADHSDITSFEHCEESLMMAPKECRNMWEKILFFCCVLISVHVRSGLRGARNIKTDLFRPSSMQNRQAASPAKIYGPNFAPVRYVPVRREKKLFVLFCASYVTHNKL